MIDAFKEMLEIVKHAPEYTMWVLLGILFYKVFIVGSWIAVARLAIIKLHDYLKARGGQERVIKYDLHGVFLDETAIGALNGIFFRLKDRDDEIDPERRARLGMFLSSGRKYVHHSDVAYLNEALGLKIMADKKAKEEQNERLNELREKNL